MIHTLRSFQTLSFMTFFSLSSLAIAVPASASSFIPLPEISPEQIASDIQRRQDPQTGTVEYYAPSFDAFESVDQIAGTVSLRSHTRSTSIHGPILRGGALLDINFFYTTETDDPYDVAGFENAVFLSGEDADSVYYDTRIVECSERIHDVVYTEDYYHGAAFGLLAGIYRPFPSYRGHRFFGSHGFNYDWRYPTGFAGSRRFGSFSRFSNGNRASRRNNFGTRNNNRGQTRRANRNNNRDQIRGLRRDRDERQDVRRDRRDRRNGFDRSNREERRNDQQVRSRDGDARNNNFNTNSNKRRVRRSGLNTIKGQGGQAQTRRTNRAPSERTIKSASERVQTRRSSSTANRPSTPQRSAPTQRSRTIKSTPSVKRSTSRSTPKQSRSSSRSNNRSQNKSSNRSSNRSSSRSSNRSISRSTNKSFRSSNRSSRNKKLNFFPQTSLFGASTYRTRTAVVSQRCAREENLSIHIPRERLDAGRYDGLTVLVLDRNGQDIPVYIPPNYIEGFRSAVYGQAPLYEQSAPQSDQYQSYQVPGSSSLEPSLFGGTNVFPGDSSPEYTPQGYPQK